MSDGEVDYSDFSDNDSRIIGSVILNKDNIDRKAILSAKSVHSIALYETVDAVVRNPGEFLFYSDVLKYYVERYKHLSLAVEGRGLDRFIKAVTEVEKYKKDNGKNLSEM